MFITKEAVGLPSEKYLTDNIDQINYINTATYPFYNANLEMTRLSSGNGFDQIFFINNGYFQIHSINKVLKITQCTIRGVLRYLFE